MTGDAVARTLRARFVRFSEKQFQPGEGVRTEHEFFIVKLKRPVCRSNELGVRQTLDECQQTTAISECAFVFRLAWQVVLGQKYVVRRSVERALVIPRE